MKANRSMPASELIPVIGFPNTLTAADWICPALNFKAHTMKPFHGAPPRATSISGMAALILLTTTSAVASAAPTGSGGLERAVARYERAQMSRDRVALEAILTNDYLLVTGGGDRENKQAFIADLTASDFKLEPYIIQSPVRRVWANGAVVAGIARQRGSAGGKPFDGCIRYADVWKLTHAGWQVAFTHVARMAAPGPAGCADR